MTMTIDANQQQRYAQFPPSLTTMSSSYPTSQPQFHNPWHSTAPSNAALYAGSPVAHSGLPPNPLSMDRHSQQPSARSPVTTTMASSYGSAMPVTSAPAGSPHSMVDPSFAAARHPHILTGSQDLMSINRMHQATTAASYADSAYHTTAASPVNATYAASPPSYEQQGMGYPSSAGRHAFGLATEADTRRYSQSSVSSAASYDPVDMTRGIPRFPLVDSRNPTRMNDNRAYAEALEASHNMMNMKFDTSNQETPRAGAGRGSGDSYGFPATHSASSSISSNGCSPYYSGSVDGSVSDYSTAGSDVESSRTLPPPHGLMATQPPAPQSMMGQFSSRVSSSTEKKHKCKVCDKRFTRPSSLQTHMYSHTGEKRKCNRLSAPLASPLLVSIC